MLVKQNKVKEIKQILRNFALANQAKLCTVPVILNDHEEPV